MDSLPAEILYNISSYLSLKNTFVLPQLNSHCAKVTRYIEYQSPFRERAEIYVLKYLSLHITEIDPKLVINDPVKFSRYSDLIKPYFYNKIRWSDRHYDLFLKIMKMLIHDNQQGVFYHLINAIKKLYPIYRFYRHRYSWINIFNRVFVCLIDIEHVKPGFIDLCIKECYSDCYVYDYLQPLMNTPVRIENLKHVGVKLTLSDLREIILNGNDNILKCVFEAPLYRQKHLYRILKKLQFINRDRHDYVIRYVTNDLRISLRGILPKRYVKQLSYLFDEC